MLSDTRLLAHPKVREVDFDKIEKQLTAEMMLEIQKVRDRVLEKIKDKLLNL